MEAYSDTDLSPLLIDTTCTLDRYLKEKKKFHKREKRLPEKEKFQRCLPQRYIFALLAFWGMANVYAMRVNLSVAILAMVNNTHKFQNSTEEVVECPELSQNTNVNQKKSFQVDQYDWTEDTVNRILGSFFYGYVLTQIPGGYMAEQMSGKYLFGYAVLITSALTAATPLAVRWGVNAMMVDRIFEGLAEGVTKPSMNSLISRWSPRLERSRVSSFIFSGGLVGNVFTLPVSGWLSTSRMFGGWPSVFYLFAVLSLLWFLFWIRFTYDSPLEHPGISEDELEYFESNQETIHKNPEVPWRAIITSLPMWAVIVSHFGSALGFLTLFTALPTYLKTVLHFDIEADGYFSALPFLCQVIGAWMAAVLADKMRESEKMNITAIRKIFNSIGLLGPAVMLFFVTLSGCRPQLIIALVCLAMALHGFAFSGFHVTHIDMSPDFAGVLFGISSSIADLNGIFGPALVTQFTFHETSTGNWNKIFYIMCMGYIVGAAFYVMFASAELQPWGLDRHAISIKASLTSGLNVLAEKKANEHEPEKTKLLLAEKMKNQT